jgi:UDP-glucose 4-epimerase
MRNVCDAAVRNGSHVVYASTSGVYGKIAIGAMVDENFHASPSSSYAIAKRFNEIYLMAQNQERQLSSVSIRYFNVYGPKQDERMVIPRFINKASVGEPLTVYGTGKQSRDFTYIDDVVEGTIRCGRLNADCEIINIARGQEVAVADLAYAIVRMTKSSSKVEFITRPAERHDFDVERRVGDSRKLRRLVNFEPAIDLEDGLQRLLNTSFDDVRPRIASASGLTPSGPAS